MHACYCKLYPDVYFLIAQRPLMEETRKREEISRNSRVPSLYDYTSESLVRPTILGKTDNLVSDIPLYMYTQAHRFSLVAAAAASHDSPDFPAPLSSLSSFVETTTTRRRFLNFPSYNTGTGIIYKGIEREDI